MIFLSRVLKLENRVRRSQRRGPGEIRSRGLVPLACSFDPEKGVAIVSHSLGQEIVEVEGEVDLERWLAGFLCELPKSGSGASGIASAARSVHG